MITKIKIYPEIIFHAHQKNLPLGAFRLWFVAKKFDRGNGFIPKKKFRKYAQFLGIRKTNYYRWLEQAEKLGLIEIQGSVIRLICLEHAARVAGVSKLNRPVLISYDKFLLNKGWLGWVWAGFHKHYEGSPITRGKLEKLSGAPAKNQLEYEKASGVKKKANYADICSPADNPELAMDVYNTPGYYGKKGRIRQRLGNTYFVSDVTLGNKGRTKQVNKALCNEDSSRRSCYALYSLDNKELKQKIKANRKWGDAQNAPKFVYLKLADLPKGTVWTVVLF